jgi:uncharacterized low-complexity protein
MKTLQHKSGKFFAKLLAVVLLAGTGFYFTTQAVTQATNENAAAKEQVAVNQANADYQAPKASFTDSKCGSGKCGSGKSEKEKSKKEKSKGEQAKAQTEKGKDKCGSGKCGSCKDKEDKNKAEKGEEKSEKQEKEKEKEKEKEEDGGEA